MFKTLTKRSLMQPIKNKKSLRIIAIIIASLAFLISLFFNELNLYHLRKDSLELRHNSTIITADDASYLNPAKNFIEKGEFKGNMLGRGAYFLRPPAYSFLIIGLSYISDYQSSITLLKYLQLTLFSISVYLLFFIAIKYIGSIKIAIVIALIYGTTNIASIFLYYTLTEGITPALLIFFIYFLIKAREEKREKNKLIFYYISALIFSFMFITRPFLGVLGIAFPFFIFKDFWKKQKKLWIQLFIIGIISSSGMIFWQIRNYKIAGEFVGLHPIYYAENSQSSFRPTHQAFWNLAKGWGETGSNFHSYMDKFWENTISGNADNSNVENIINSLPNDVTETLGRERFRDMFNNYQSSILYQKYYIENNLAMPNKIPELELKTISQIETLERDFKSKFWFRYYVVSPLKAFKEISFHSNLSLYIFQKTYRGNWLMEALRLFCFSVHSLAFILLIFSLLHKTPMEYKSIFSFALLIYVFYLIFVQRGVEERYTLPILSLVLISFGKTINSIYLWVKKDRLIRIGKIL